MLNEILPQEKPCDCVRVRDSHIYVTAGTEFPGKLLEEASGLIPVAIATFSPISCSSLQTSRSLGKTKTVSYRPAAVMLQDEASVYTTFHQLQ